MIHFNLWTNETQLHFYAPSAQKQLYENKWSKEEHLYASLSTEHSSFGLLDYAENKRRRDLLLPFFSRRAILQMQSIVQDNVSLIPS